MLKFISLMLPLKEISSSPFIDEKTEAQRFTSRYHVFFLFGQLTG